MNHIVKHWLLTAAAALSFSPFSFANIAFSQNQHEVVFAPKCNHVPISFQYTLEDTDFDESLITVNSDSDWAIPSVNAESNRIDVHFDSQDLIASYTATVTVSFSGQTTELFVQATVPPLDVYRLLDDPSRSITYGIQKNGINAGSILAFDPIEESLISCITVGKNPTDFVINDDSSELLVINSVSETIDVIDLTSFELKETIVLPEYGKWGSEGDTAANIDLGPNNVVYYTDGNWGPVLRVLDRSQNKILQSIIFNGSSPSNSTGFMDFAVTKDKTRIVAMPQYGWSAGSHSSTIGQFSINPDGTVNVDKTTSISNFPRDPFEAPVLLTADDEIAVMKTVAVDANDIENTLASFPSAIWSISPNGKVVATSNALYEFDTGNELYSFSSSNGYNSSYVYSKAQAFTSDYSRFIHFNSQNRSLQVIHLEDEIGSEVLGLQLNPASGSTVVGLDKLTWLPIAGTDEYDVYLGTNESDVTSADTSSSLYIGRVTGASLTLMQALQSGSQYYWRVDPVNAGQPEIGTVQSFSVSPIEFSQNKIEEKTLSGFADFQVAIQLTALQGAVNWSATSTDDWVSLAETSGSTPATFNISLDATKLPLGVNKSSITFTIDGSELTIPVKLRVNPIHLTHVRSDRNSSIVYAISEDTSSPVSSAYLLEIDSATESIKRIMPVGSSVTDFAIHYADDLLYVTNWKAGDLLTIDRNSFELQKTIEFEPAGATGYSFGDVYRVAAGVSQRVIVEEQDQWVDISFFDTQSEVQLAKASVREGGGDFGPNGRYYYHGENNSSGASIIKFDTSGDAMTQLAEIRPTEIYSSYGSRTVVVSEDGSRVFWAGAVLDDDLNSEWQTPGIVYSASSDGRYAFTSEAIFDVNLRRQVFAMPSNTQVSGFNSTSEKLVVEQSGSLKFYAIAPQSTMPAPNLSVTEQTDNSVKLSWTDNSLEMGFAIQSQKLGETEWTDIYTTEANQTSWVANNLELNTSFGFRIRAFTEDQSSAWSNLAYKQADDVISALELRLSPVNGSIVNAPNSLTWTFIPWIEEYDIYLGSNKQDVIDADTSSALYLGRIAGSNIELSQTLLNNTEYFWRIEPIIDNEVGSSPVYSFTVSRIALDKSQIQGQTITGFADYKSSIKLDSANPGEPWTVESTDDWVIFEESSGVTPATLNLTLDASAIPLGENISVVTLTNADGELNIPISLNVEPLSLSHIRSDRNSSTVYAISEVLSSTSSFAYLLEIDSTSEVIQRVLPVGSSVTDFTIHYEDDLLYVTNWKAGNLLAIDKNTFELQKIIAFQPAGATGYSAGDVYRVAAGVSQRIVVEEEDQWINISLFDTASEQELADVHSREGGGAFGPEGRYYYHGENNSSGASIAKFDTSGDTFTRLADVRPANMSNYYGSRTVVVSEDGSRVFWAGVVLDQDLEPEWQTSSTVYSTSSDGRYAFTNEAIFDVNLRRQILSMPTNSIVSGFNSSSEKLVVQVDGELKFYKVSTQATTPVPSLNIVTVTDNAITLNWTDNSLELGFVIQRRDLSSQTWQDVYSTQANITSWTDNNVAPNVDYEYRIRASTGNTDSAWSNVAIVSDQPIAYNDSMQIVELKEYTINVIANDVDPDGELDEQSVSITQQPSFGEVTVLTNGQVTYVPDNNFMLTDTFSYTVSDKNGQVSNSASVDIIYIPPMVIKFEQQLRNSVTLTWLHQAPETWVEEFELQIRQLDDDSWQEPIRVPAGEITITVGDLAEAQIYEFRIRAISTNTATQWSNIIQSSLAPIAEPDVLLIAAIEDVEFTLTDNDSDPDGIIIASSITIVESAKFGQIVLDSEGIVTYKPESSFTTNDSFSYTVKDDAGILSNQTTVEIIYVSSPVLDTSNSTHNSVSLNWNDNTPSDLNFGFEIQQRRAGESDWQVVGNASVGQTSWTATNLQAKTTYEFRIRAQLDEFSTLWSNTSAINTLAEPIKPDVASPQSGSSGGSSGIYLLVLILFSIVVRRGQLNLVTLNNNALFRMLSSFRKR